jgi:pyridoxamine 5'-phosphate oxidase
MSACHENPDIYNLRQEYKSRPFDETTVPAHPVVLFEAWFEEARSAQLAEPNAMSLATATPGGAISCRTVLLKAYDKDGFVFFTNYESEKAQQIAANPNVACLFPWLPLSRQVEITGVAEKIPTSESLAYFLKRPLKSQIGAWVSAQSSVISSRQILEAKFAEMCKKFAAGRVPLPGAWGGYRVIPRTIEFWQGGSHRLHDRIQYTHTATDWEITRLSP